MNQNQAIISTGDPYLDIIASVFRLAVEDARAGDPDAIAWLAVVAPDWSDQAEKWAKRIGKPTERYFERPGQNRRPHTVTKRVAVPVGSFYG